MKTFALLLLLTSAAVARDLGQWDNADPFVAEWFRTIKQPDNPGMSCCGEADAWWADGVEVKDGQLYAVITDDRDDAPLRRRHIPVGTKIAIPSHKITYKYGNPTGHVVIFLNARDDVYCFVQNGGV